MPHTTSKQINQNIDTLTQEDSDVVIHQNSNQKNKSIPRHCSILMVLGQLGSENTLEANFKIPGRGGDSESLDSSQQVEAPSCRGEEIAA